MSLPQPPLRRLTGDCVFSGTADSSYQAALTAGWDNLYRQAGVYGLFQEMEDRDAHLFSVLQTRKNALLACDWRVLPHDETARSMQVAAKVEEVLGGIENLQSALYHLLDAMAKGFAVAEIIWKQTATGVAIESIHARFQNQFAFDATGQLWYLSPEDAALAREATIRFVPRPGEYGLYPHGATQLPARKFLHFAFQGNACQPYGAALCARAYWYYWYKRNNLRNWSLFNEKYGSPTAVARYATGTSAEEVARLTEILGDLSRYPGVAVPDGVELSLLEAKRSGAASTYLELADWCNDEMSRIVLGQTLTVGEGRRSGSMALGEVHNQVRRDYLNTDARSMAHMLTAQLVRWIVDFNFGIDVPAPRWKWETASGEEMESQLRVDRELLRMGLPIGVEHLHETYRRPAPVKDELTLRYDDANTYQYHLAFGVLTVNEVRKQMGLPPVPWGDAPPSRTGDGLPLATPREGDRNEDESSANEASADMRRR